MVSVFPPALPFLKLHDEDEKHEWPWTELSRGLHFANCAIWIATSNDPWGPVGSDMAEIAQMTFSGE